MTTPRDSYTWNYRELATLFILSESSAKGGLGSLGENLATELVCVGTSKFSKRKSVSAYLYAD